MEVRVLKTRVSNHNYENDKTCIILFFLVTFSAHFCFKYVKIGCETLVIGSADPGPKELLFYEEYKCPTVITKHEWLNDESYDDTFSLTQNGMNVVVKRTDTADWTKGWGMNLKIECCKDGKYLTIAWIDLYRIDIMSSENHDFKLSITI